MIADYILKLEGKEIPLLFNTWMYRQYSILSGIEYEDLIQLMQSGKPFLANQIPLLLLTAGETYARYNKQPWEYTEMDACAWMDEVGAFATSPVIKDICVMFMARLLKIEPEQLTAKVEKLEDEQKEEKKSTRGKTSSGKALKRA